VKTIQGQNFKIEWKGEEFLIEMDKKFKNAVEKKAAQNIEKQAKQFCPVGKTIKTSSGKSWQSKAPGTLRNSIKARKSKFKGGGWIVTAGSHDAFYSGFVELGTKKMTASPYLRPALHIESHKLTGHLIDAKKKVKYLR